jgi:hypothetical protein
MTAAEQNAFDRIAEKLGAKTGPFYIAISGDHTGTYIAERAVKDCTYSKTIEDIASGEIRDLVQVIEIGTGRDMTEQMARAVMTGWAHSGEPLTDWQRDFVELHVGIGAANSFRKVA